MPVQALLELQRTAGNEAVAQAVATGSVQRDDAKPADAPVDLRPHLLNLKGVSLLKCPDPAPPWLPKAGKAPPAKADSDEPLNLWTLDFDALVDDDSPLGRELARAKRERLILSGGKGDADSPLGLQLSNAAINILANTDRGREVVKDLHLDKFTVVVDPTGGNYGIAARFTFGK